MIADNVKLYSGVQPQPKPAAQPNTPPVPGYAGRWGGGQMDEINPTYNIQGSKYDSATTVAPAKDSKGLPANTPGASPGSLPAGAPIQEQGKVKNFDRLIKSISDKQSSEWGGSYMPEVGQVNGMWKASLDKLDADGINPETQPLDLVKSFVRGDSLSQLNSYFKMLDNLKGQERVEYFNRRFGAK